jgi:hypothetical protein
VKNNYCAYVSKGLRLSFLEKDGVDNVRTSPCCHLHYDYIDDKIQKFSALEDIDSVLSHQMRKYFIDYFKNNDTLHPACATCIHHEKNGVKSVRQKFNELDKENKDFDFLKLDVIIGNLCNLACPFCNQGSSSLIEQISSKYNQSKLPFHWNDAHKNNRASPKITGQVCAELLKKYNDVFPKWKYFSYAFYFIFSVSLLACLFFNSLKNKARFLNLHKIFLI